MNEWKKELNKYVTRGGLTAVIFALFLCPESYAAERSLDLWVCPAGGYEDASAVQELADDYAAKTDVNVNVRILDPVEGPEELTKALGTEEAPDLVLASPEDIVTRWGGSGYMEDLGDLWDETVLEEIDPEIREACISRDGIFYQMPVFRDVYTMAINYETFDTTAVLQYLNEDVHSWKDSGFIDCVLVLHDYVRQHEDRDITVAKIPCLDGRDHRYFMSFISNLSNGSLISDTRSSYTVSSSAIRNSFAILKKLVGKGVVFDQEISSEDEINEFLSGELPVTFFWNWYRHQKYADSAEFTVFPMMYPNSKNLPVLTGDICGFGVVKGEDGQTVQDAIDFVRFVTEDPDEYRKAVSLSACFPVRTRVKGSYVSDLYPDGEDARLFRAFTEYFKDYVPTMPLFYELDLEWPQLVRGIASGGRIKDLTVPIDEELNEKLQKEYGIVENVLE